MSLAFDSKFMSYGLVDNSDSILTSADYLFDSSTREASRHYEATGSLNMSLNFVTGVSVAVLSDFGVSQILPRDLRAELKETRHTLVRGNKFQVREGVGNFRACFARMIRNQLYMVYRREKVRGLGTSVSVEDVELSVPAKSVTAAMDAERAVSRHRAAVEHVLTKNQVSQAKCASDG